jgi:peptide/nickel transport system ATP-binding protein/oligopeptide transport system ATP-binding protein
LETVPNIRGPRADKLRVIQGQPPILSKAPESCPFRARCPQAFERCTRENPVRFDLGASHDAACFWDFQAGAARDV